MYRTPTTAGTLPADLLLCIWEEAELDPMITSRTCHNWRRLAHNMSSLWTHIVIDDARPGTSLCRARHYVQRNTAGQLRLHVTRKGAEQGMHASELGPLDTFTLGVIGSCASFKYEGMYTEGLYGFGRKLFIIALLGKTSDLLEVLHLSTDTDPVEVPPMIGLTPSFPRLNTLSLVDVCLPLATMGIATNLQEFEFIEDCDPHTCVNRTAMTSVNAIIAASPALRVLIGVEFALRCDGVYADTHGTLDLAVILSRPVKRLILDWVPITWPDYHRLQVMHITDLVYISLRGTLTFPCSTAPNAGAHWSDDFSRFLALLALCPSLESLELSEWYLPGPSHQFNMNNIVQLQHLTNISIWNSQVVWVETFLRNVEVPGLRVLSIANVYFDEDDNHARSIWPQPRSWRFPRLEWLQVEIKGPKPAGLGTHVSALDIASMFERGEWRKLRTAVFKVAGCIRNVDLRRAIEVLENPAIAPSLTELWIPNELDCDWVDSVVAHRNDLHGDKNVVLGWDFVDTDEEETDEE